jgi:hypothetical protein
MTRTGSVLHMLLSVLAMLLEPTGEVVHALPEAVDLLVDRKSVV